MYDLCIIGGGASGISTAITAARKGLKVIIVEKNEKLGKKIYATGNGRCNITNHDFKKPYSNYYFSSDNNYISFLEKVFYNQYPDDEIIDFLKSVGIYTYDINSYVYPSSLQASALMWALIDELNRLKVEIALKTEIIQIDINNRYFILNASNRQIKALNVVLACGGASYSKLGGSLSGLNIIKKLNLNYVQLNSALCGVITKEDLSNLSGVRIKAKAYINNKSTDYEYGELQITDYGLSGIMIFNLSSMLGKMINKNEKAELIIDFLPDINDQIIIDSFFKFKNRNPKGILNNFINDKLSQHLINKLPNAEDEQNIKKLIDIIHNYKIEVVKLRDFENSQVTAGGLSLEEINPTDMSIKKINGLYSVGELTDIDGKCGGYNLTYAIISGIRAGEGVYDKIKSN